MPVLPLCNPLNLYFFYSDRVTYHFFNVVVIQDSGNNDICRHMGHINQLHLLTLIQSKNR